MKHDQKMDSKFLCAGTFGGHPAPKGISRFWYEEETGKLPSGPMAVSPSAVRVF